jgi:hypothetical protein
MYARARAAESYSRPSITSTAQHPRQCGPGGQEPRAPRVAPAPRPVLRRAGGRGHRQALQALRQRPRLLQRVGEHREAERVEVPRLHAAGAVAARAGRAVLHAGTVGTLPPPLLVGHRGEVADLGRDPGAGAGRVERSFAGRTRHPPAFGVQHPARLAAAPRALPRRPLRQRHRPERVAGDVAEQGGHRGGRQAVKPAALRPGQAADGVPREVGGVMERQRPAAPQARRVARLQMLLHRGVHVLRVVVRVRPGQAVARRREQS